MSNINDNNDNIVSLNKARQEREELIEADNYQDDNFVEYSAVFTYRNGDDFPECNFLMNSNLVESDGNNLSHRIHTDLLAAINMIRSNVDLPMIDPQEIGEPDYDYDD